jgi:phage head maturation protease
VARLCLNTHSRYDLNDVLGVIEKASLANGEGRATVRFSARDDVAPIAKDVEDGIIRNVSVGYKVNKVEKTRDANGMLTVRVVDWEPMELSLVPIGADAGAGVRNEQQTKFPCEIISNRAEAATQRRSTR